MKKTLAIIIIIFLIITFAVMSFVVKIQTQTRQTKKENMEYEYYLNKEMYGTDVATLINKAVESNKKNNIQIDENNFYIDNKENSIKIDLKMITIEKTYQMESIRNNDITTFVQYFNLIKFKCSSIEYHKKTGKISRIIFEQIEK